MQFYDFIMLRYRCPSGRYVFYSNKKFQVSKFQRYRLLSLHTQTLSIVGEDRNPSPSSGFLKIHFAFEDSTMIKSSIRWRQTEMTVYH